MGAAAPENRSSPAPRPADGSPVPLPGGRLRGCRAIPETTSKLPRRRQRSTHRKLRLESDPPAGSPHRAGAAFSAQYCPGVAGPTNLGGSTFRLTPICVFL